VHAGPSPTVPILVAGVGEFDGGGRIRVAFQNPAHRGMVVFGGRAARRMVEKCCALPPVPPEGQAKARDHADAAESDETRMATTRKRRYGGIYVRTP
jgi:hypothetical protein